MLLVDANVLLYAVNADGPNHACAREWLDRSLGGREPVALCLVVVLAFLRISTRAALFPRPLSVEEAADVLEQWSAQPPVVFLDPGARHLGLMHGLVREVGTAGNLVGDAHLAALALEYGAQIVSFDRDFGRFSGVRHRLPE